MGVQPKLERLESALLVSSEEDSTEHFESTARLPKTGLGDVAMKTGAGMEYGFCGCCCWNW
jgi:hypothetical protein